MKKAGNEDCLACPPKEGGRQSLPILQRIWMERLIGSSLLVFRDFSDESAKVFTGIPVAPLSDDIGVDFHTEA